MNYKLYILNSFTANGSGGNVAGVILDADLLGDDYKQQIAAKHGFSEIAYVSKSDCADFKLEFFTPNGEVELCGHATVATFGLLKQLQIIDNGLYTAELKAGIIEIDVSDVVLMEQILPKYDVTVDKLSIAKSLNINSEKIVSDLPCQKVSTGLYDIIVPIVDFETLNSIEPNFQIIKDLSIQYDVTGYHLYTIDNGKYYTRNFAPRYAIDEESATGSASGALASYLYNYKMLPLNQQITFIQGVNMNQTSLINVVLKGESTIEQVLVGGSVSNYKIIEEQLKK